VGIKKSYLLFVLNKTEQLSSIRLGTALFCRSPIGKFHRKWFAILQINQYPSKEFGKTVFNLNIGVFVVGQREVHEWLM